MGNDGHDKKRDMTYTQNRELSWLRFDERVLAESMDESVPLFERLKFIAIFETEDLDRLSRAMVESLDDATHRRVERLAVAAAGQKADSNHRYPSRSWCAPADGTASEVFSHVHQCTPNGASRGPSAPIAYIHASL